MKLYKGNKLIEGESKTKFNDHCRPTWLGSDERVDCSLRVVEYLKDMREKVTLATPYGDPPRVKNDKKGQAVLTYVEIIDIENADMTVINYLLSRNSKLESTGVYKNRFLVRVLGETGEDIFPEIGSIISSKDVRYAQNEERIYVHANGYHNF